MLIQTCVGKEKDSKPILFFSLEDRLNAKHPHSILKNHIWHRIEMGFSPLYCQDNGLHAKHKTDTGFLKLD
ncbi:MAG: hypothetical protein ABIP95_07735 [Pelobium sp.]